MRNKCSASVFLIFALFIIFFAFGKLVKKEIYMDQFDSRALVYLTKLDLHHDMNYNIKF